MDLYKAIQELYAEKERLERVITSLEQLQQTGGTPEIPLRTSTRRGRKTMGARERQEVSARMKKYWADRRDSGHRGTAQMSAAMEAPVNGESSS